VWTVAAKTQVDPKDDAEKRSNALYAISVARKIGACVFIVPEDVLEVTSPTE
jgi:hypothetical protein